MQRLVQPPRAEQPAKAVDPPVLRSFEFVQLQIALPEGLVELSRARADRPLRPERRETAGDLFEADAVGAGVRAGALGELDPAVRHRLAHDLGDLADLEVLVGPSDVEDLAVDGLARRFEHGEEGARDVLDVDERPPGRAVALQVDAAVVTAHATRLLRTMSKRRRGETP